MWSPLLLFICAQVAQVLSEYKVNTTQGVIIGHKATDGDYATFYGIPYGKSTAGQNRFKAPTEPPKYPGDFIAIKSDVICTQPSPRGIIGTDDCLVLSIFTKDITTPKPVFVWLEGEEYKSTIDKPQSYKTLVQEGLLVVSMNYRLSIFGFLCLRVPEAPGNAGLKDVIQGLKWIQENIAAFGGDPNNVMLAGHGSGAAMVNLITLSPLSKNLIHKALVLSGSDLASWAVSYDPIGYAQKVGEKLGYTNKSPSELAKLLSTTDLGVLNPVLMEFNFYNNTSLFAPCVENVKLNGALLHDDPINILRSKNYRHIPYVAGFTVKEEKMRAEQAISKSFENSTVTKNDTDSIRKSHFDEKVINNGTLKEFHNYVEDILVLKRISTDVYERALTSNSSVFIFEYVLNGSEHGSIRDYLLYSTAHDKDDLKQRVVAFAQTGSPNLKNFKQWIPVNMAVETPTTSVPLTTSTIVGKKNSQKKIMHNNNSINFRNNSTMERQTTAKPVSSAQSLVSFGLILSLTQMLLNFLAMS